MSSFPLLRLPTLALAEVLKLMRIAELVQLSKASINSFKIIKNYVRGHFKLRIYAYSYQAEVHVYSKNDFCRFEINISDSFVEEYMKDISSMVCHLTSLFNCPIHHAKIVYLSDDLFWKIANWLKIQQKVYNKLSIWSEKESDVTRFLEHVEAREGLHLVVDFSPDFSYYFKNVPNELSIARSHWFNINQFFEMNVEKLLLDKSLFTNNDLDLLVTKWKSGDLPKLKHICVFSQNINNQTPIAGMLPPIQNNEKGHVMKEIIGWGISIEGSVDIQRDDGFNGKLLVQPGRFFSLFVCD